MEKADKIIQFKKKAPEIIRKKVEAYDNPLDDMTLHSSTQKSKYFTRESDVLLLVLTDKIGYGKWREIQQAIRKDIRGRFDHLLLSRSEIELQRRVDILVKSMEKEDNVVVKKSTPIDELTEMFAKALNELREQDAILIA
jgi:hypothetical protein